MNCPKCNSRMKVMEQRSNGFDTYRRYKCPECDWLIHTEEKATDKAKRKLYLEGKKYLRKKVDK